MRRGVRGEGRRSVREEGRGGGVRGERLEVDGRVVIKTSVNSFQVIYVNDLF